MAFQILLDLLFIHLNKTVLFVQPVLIPGGLGAEGSEMLSSLLAASPPEQQKHILGERLYPLVAHHQVRSFILPFSALSAQR